MNINFTKMHGLGNDFILIDCRELDFGFRLSDFGTLSRKLCDRRFGIGADQLLLLYPSDIGDFMMRIFNSDGSEVEMCGNGIRCFAKYIWDQGLSGKDRLEVETLAGIIRPEKAGALIKVDMGEPVFEADRIPVNIKQGQEKLNAELNPKSKIQNPKLPDPEIIADCPLQIGDREFKITCVSMGNPHAVIVVDNVSSFNIAYYGSLLEKHPIFPNRTNVEFIEVLNASEIKMRVWERGSGETMACGTGASAVAVAANLKGLTARNVTVHLAGGDLFIEWGNDNHVYMSGPAEKVFRGNICLKE